GFQRIFPARLDVELLPQPPRSLDAMCGRPCRGIRPATDFRLQCGERLRPRFALGERAARTLPGVALDAVALLQRVHDVVELVERLFALGQIHAFLLELLAYDGNFARRPRCQITL